MPWLKHLRGWPLVAGIVMVLSLFACKRPGPPPPPIPAATMEKILLDLQLAETYSLGLGDSIKNRFTKNKDSLAVFYQAVFARHKITADSFIQAMNWYAEHPGLTDSLFNSALDRLNRERARLNISSDGPETVEVPVPNPDSNKLNKDVGSEQERPPDTAARLLTPRQKPETTP